MNNKNIFNTVKMTRPPASHFDLTHDFKFTCGLGELIPVMLLECIPGDRINVSQESLIRFQPLISPVMHLMNVTTHTFFVPWRILWENFEKWVINTPGVAPPVFDIFPGYTTNQNRFLDYMGIPPVPVGNAQVVSALPFAAYQCIYNEYYRDQNLVPEINYKLTDGNNTRGELVELRKRAYEHDYFTSCLPFAQKGQPVALPIGNVDGTAPVYANRGGGGNTVLTSTPQTNLALANVPALSSDVYADINLQVNATTINDLRVAFRLQEWLEKNARGGTRYSEFLLVHYAKKSADARLNRPEYITGSKTPVVISEVLNTNGTIGGNVQANMAGHGISVGSGNNGYYNVDEHGYMITIMSVLPKTAYSQGIHRTYFKQDPLELYNPVFAHLGEQPVYNKEIFAYSAQANDIFGYLPRFSEYRFIDNRIAGKLRTNLDFWTMTRRFASTPTLSQEFIECNPNDANITDIFAVGDFDDQLICTILNRVHAIRPMPKFGTPTF